MVRAKANVVTLSEAEFEQRLNETHYLGEASGLESAAGRLRLAASALFLAKDEIGARKLRDLADDFQHDASRLREKWGVTPKRT